MSIHERRSLAMGTAKRIGSQAEIPDRRAALYPRLTQQMNPPWGQVRLKRQSATDDEGIVRFVDRAAQKFEVPVEDVSRLK